MLDNTRGDSKELVVIPSLLPILFLLVRALSAQAQLDSGLELVASRGGLERRHGVARWRCAGGAGRFGEGGRVTRAGAGGLGFVGVTKVGRKS